MNKNITFTVDSDVYEKFNIALDLSGESSDEAANACLRWYIAQAFENASKEYTPKVSKQTDDNKDFYGKALQRIPMWALKPNQYNHKIIKAYFMNDEQKAVFHKEALIPDGVSLELENFEEFYEKRKELLTAKIRQLLG